MPHGPHSSPLVFAVSLSAAGSSSSRLSGDRKEHRWLPNLAGFADQGMKDAIRQEHLRQGTGEGAEASSVDLPKLWGLLWSLASMTMGGAYT